MPQTGQTPSPVVLVCPSYPLTWPQEVALAHVYVASTPAAGITLCCRELHVLTNKRPNQVVQTDLQQPHHASTDQQSHLGCRVKFVQLIPILYKQLCSAVQHWPHVRRRPSTIKVGCQIVQLQNEHPFWHKATLDRLEA